MKNQNACTDPLSYRDAVVEARRRARSTRLYGVVLPGAYENDQEVVALHLCATDDECGCTDRIIHIQTQDILVRGTERVTEDGKEVLWFDIEINATIIEEVYVRHTVVAETPGLHPSLFDCGLPFNDPLFAIKTPITPVGPTPIVPVGPTPIVPVGPTPIVPVGPTPIVPVGPTPIVPVGPTPIVPVGPTPIVPVGPTPIVQP